MFANILNICFEMLSKHKFLLSGLAFFLAIVLFEAAQQHFYITRFNLNSEGVSYWYLLRNHASLWMFWSLTALILYQYVRSRPIRSDNFGSKLLWHYGTTLAAMLILALCLISFFQLFFRGAELSTFWEFFQFYAYQKTALFVSAYLGLIILLHLHRHHQDLALKVMEMSELKEKNSQLYEDLKAQAFQDHTSIIHVKIGHQLKAIPLSEIIWVQADDYCVRLHTKSQNSLLLRKSMKAMEQELTEQGFLRLHRNAIVNLNEVESFRFNSSPQVQLKQGETLKIASSRVSHIKGVLNQT